MRGLAAVAVAGVAALMVRRWLSVREAFAAVRPELRSPLLHFMPTVSARALPVNRYVARRRTSAGTGVTVAERHVGQQSVRVLVTEPVEKAPLHRAAVDPRRGDGGRFSAVRAQRDRADRARPRCGRGCTGISAGARASLSCRAGRLHGCAEVDAFACRRIGHRPRPDRRHRLERGRRPGGDGGATRITTRGSTCARRHWFTRCSMTGSRCERALGGVTSCGRGRRATWVGRRTSDAPRTPWLHRITRPLPGVSTSRA